LSGRRDLRPGSLESLWRVKSDERYLRISGVADNFEENDERERKIRKMGWVSELKGLNLELRV
jgi:hypothetical protein